MPVVTVGVLFALLAAAPVSASLSVEDALRSPTLRAVGGPIETPLPLEFVNFLLDHPDMTAWFASQRGIARYSVDRKGAGEHAADDHQGARGRVALLERTERARLYYGEGDYKSRVFPTIRAGAAVSLSMSTAAKAGCPESAFTEYRVSVRLNNRVLSGAAQPLVPFLRATIHRKFGRAFAVARKIAILLAEDAKGAGAELAAYPQLDAAGKSELARLLALLPPRPVECR